MKKKYFNIKIKIKVVVKIKLEKTVKKDIFIDKIFIISNIYNQESTQKITQCVFFI